MSAEIDASMTAPRALLADLETRPGEPFERKIGQAFSALLDQVERERAAAAHWEAEYDDACATYDQAWQRGAQYVVDALKEFLPGWNYPAHVVAAISLEIKARLDHARPTPPEVTAQ